MTELAALGLYSAQWLGVALGVGAQTVLLLAHLLERHESKHQWLGFTPGARAAQAAGLFLMVASGIGAVLLHLYLRNLDTLLQPAFAFKWMLIVLLYGAYRLEQQDNSRLQAAVEGFAGATWYAMFVIHSVAPITSWVNLFVLYALWLAAFAALWSSFVFLMGKTSKEPKVVVVKVKEELKAVPPPKMQAPPEPKPVVPPPPAAPLPPKPAPPPPKVTPAPPRVPPPVPVTPPIPRISIWARLHALFARRPKKKIESVSAPQPLPVKISAPAPAAAPKPPPPAPIVAHAPIVVSFPVPPKPPVAVAMHPPNIPSAPVRFDMPKPVVSVAQPAPVQKSAAAHIEKSKEPTIDYMQLPAIQIMPQKPEEVEKRNRGPVVMPEDESSLEGRSKAAVKALGL